jgi:hypothetical protein
LRALCIIALDLLHVLRHMQPLSRQKRNQLATFLDFQACANAAWDRKELCAAHYRALRQRLENAGLQPWIEDYLSQLRALETQRPPIGGDRRHFDEVRSYREAVARLALATIAAIALNAESIEDGIHATHCDSDVATLFHMAMQCQIVDDVVDYTSDRSAGLPSFMTASASLPLAITLTVNAARSYGASPERASGSAAFPLRVALRVLTMVTTLVVRVHATRDGASHHTGTTASAWQMDDQRESSKGSQIGAHWREGKCQRVGSGSRRGSC